MTDRRVRKTRTAIHQALASLLSEKEPRDITIRELCERADINKSTFYLHFHDIYDCTDHFLEALAEPITEIISGYSYTEMLTKAPEMWNRVLDIYRRDFSLYAPLLKSSGLTPLLHQMEHSIMEKIFSQYEHTGTGLPNKYAITFIVRGFMGVLQEYDLDELSGPVLDDLSMRISRGFLE